MKELKEILIFTCAIMLLSFTFVNKKTHTIIEGESVGNIKLGMSIFQVDSILKSEYERIIWAKYSYEYHYKDEGISIWEKQNDTTHAVFAITVYPNKWKGITGKGLKINRKLKIKDVIEIYGKPEWGYTGDCSELDAEYSDIGIYFSVDTISGICDETGINHDSLFSDKNVIEMTIGKIGTDY